jgi:hypothetical protein
MQTLLGFIGLQTGTELITLALIFNKVTGLYGILAIITGYSLSALQLSTYIYSIGVLATLVCLLPHVRRQSPIECLALAWVYILDTLISLACTSVFATNWYLSSTPTNSGHGKTPDVGGRGGQNPDNTPTTHSARSDAAVRQGMPQDTAMSFILIVAFTLVRVYLSLVVAAFARQALRQHMDHQRELDVPRGKETEEPFAPESDGGQGWKAWLGRRLVSVGKGYWMDLKDQEDWTRSLNERFRKQTQTLRISESVGTN